MQNISASSELRAMWEKYRRQFEYAKEIEFINLLEALGRIMV